jgi:hypothetical protein
MHACRGGTGGQTGAVPTSKNTCAASTPPFTWLLEPMITNADYRIEDATCADDGIFTRYLGRAS